jgi:hypothetical protein
LSDDGSSDPTERVARTFPLSEWVWLAKTANDGWPLPAGVDWDAYTVELIDRMLTDEDNTHAPGEIISQHLAFEGAESKEERAPDGTLISFESRGGRAWRHVRTLIRHPDVTARLRWEWDGTTFGQIAIVGLEEDPDPVKSCRILLKAIQLLRDNEWRGQAKAGRPELSDDDVRHDLEKALDRCQRKGHERPSIRQLADEHDRRYDPYAEIIGISETALRERMRRHPGPFRDVVPWIARRKKREPGEEGEEGGLSAG